jgi:ABC-type antimicrobial peptide transport system permease subunit
LSFWGGDFTIVGVVKDLKTTSLSDDATPQYYVPQGKLWGRIAPSHFVLALEADVSAVLPLVRDRIWSVAPDLPVIRVSPVTELISGTLAEQRYRARLMLAFSGTAIFLALFGVYGLASHSVAFRTREMAIRVALGADRARVVSAVLFRGASVALLGSGAGLVLAFAATHTLGSFFSDTETNNSLTLFLVAASVGLMSLVASLPASIRATRADPMMAVREE